MQTKKAWDQRFKREINNHPFDFKLKREIDSFLKKLDKKAKILDIGCGIGEKTNYVHQKGFNICGTDSSETAVEYAKKRFKKNKIL